MTITVRPVPDLQAVTPALAWVPLAGEEALGFLEEKHAKDNIAADAMNRVLFEAQQILGRCVDPNSPGTESTGLVVGYVQSGKTLSFTTLAALAHDNGFGLIVLIAGTKDNLREQTRERMRVDLRIGSMNIGRPWLALDNPSPGSADAGLMADALRNWHGTGIPTRHKKACLVTVLKQHQRLAKLAKCLAASDLRGVPTLVIDDESDQATPNNFAGSNRTSGEARLSTTYREILGLKAQLPHHTYVQYTATPQAPLLMALEDRLSPAFAELVTPGEGYVGGSTFFAGGVNPYVQTIPPVEVAATLTSNPAPPSSLIQSLAIYLLGACANEHAQSSSIRTMMVHPAQQTGPHKDYVEWVRALIESWKAMADSGHLRADLEGLFERPHQSLTLTVPNLPALSALLALLPQVLRLVTLREVNSTPAGRAPIQWSACIYWILIGGAKLDRGFTVEGLTVTYMPRGLGDGSADSLQQRARFCGYKQRYLGFCRIYLESEVRIAFEQYVAHEEEIHRCLEQTRGKPLKEWVRSFKLHESMQPTRRSVIALPLRPFEPGKWHHPRAAHRDAASNAGVLTEFLRKLEAGFAGEPAQEVDPDRYIDKRANAPKNMLHQAVPAAFITTLFLEPFSASDPDDEFVRSSACMALSRLASNEPQGAGALVDVFVMAEGQSLERSREGGDFINQVFQGKDPNTNDRTRLRYSGDRDFSSEARPTFHVRRFTIKAESGGGSRPEVADAAWYALHIPTALGDRYLIQDGD